MSSIVSAGVLEAGPSESEGYLGPAHIQARDREASRTPKHCFEEASVYRSPDSEELT